MVMQKLCGTPATKTLNFVEPGTYFVLKMGNSPLLPQPVSVSIIFFNSLNFKSITKSFINVILIVIKNTVFHFQELNVKIL